MMESTIHHLPVPDFFKAAKGVKLLLFIYSKSKKNAGLIEISHQAFKKFCERNLPATISYSTDDQEYTDAKIIYIRDVDFK